MTTVKLFAPIGVGGVTCIDGTQAAVGSDGSVSVDSVTAEGLIAAGFLPFSPPPFSTASAIMLRDDFIYPAAAFPTSATAGVPWVKKIVGAGPPTVALVANTAGGIAQIALEATSEKQDAVLYAGDQVVWDATKGLVVDMRVKLSVLPTTGSKLVFGLAAAWIDGPNNNTYFLRFGADGNGTILAESFDGSTNVSVTTGVTVTTSAWHNFRIDATNPASVKYYIDNVAVATASTFVAPGTTHPLQPYVAGYKASGTSVGTLQLDVIHIWNGR